MGRTPDSLVIFTHEAKTRAVAITAILKYRSIDQRTAGDGKQPPQPQCSRFSLFSLCESVLVLSGAAVSLRFFFKMETMAAALVAKPNATSPV